MKVEIEFTPGGSMSDVTVTLTGRGSCEEIQRWRGALVADPRYRPNLRVLVDYSGVDITDLGTGELRTIGERFFDQLERVGSGARWAIVAEPEVVYGCARMALAAFESECARRGFSGPPLAFAIFRRRAEAMTWLNGTSDRPASEVAYAMQVPRLASADDEREVAE